MKNTTWQERINDPVRDICLAYIKTVSDSYTAFTAKKAIEDRDRFLLKIENLKDFIQQEIDKALDEQKREIVEETVNTFKSMQERYPEFALDLELYEGEILVNTTKYERTLLSD